MENYANIANCMFYCILKNLCNLATKKLKCNRNITFRNVVILTYNENCFYIIYYPNFNIN